jgi:uncharacterized protein YndB with AHSA1/START domain
MPSITITTSVHASLTTVWERWTQTKHVIQWNAASDDWFCPRAENDLRTGGQFTYRMEARDGSAGFDFGGTYRDVTPNQHIAYAMEDGRTVDVTFEASGDQVTITETFDAESENPLEMQRAGWQSILDRFKAYAERP